MILIQKQKQKQKQKICNKTGVAYLYLVYFDFHHLVEK